MVNFEQVWGWEGATELNRQGAKTYQGRQEFVSNRVDYKRLFSSAYYQPLRLAFVLQLNILGVLRGSWRLGGFFCYGGAGPFPQ